MVASYAPVDDGAAVAAHVRLALGELDGEPRLQDFLLQVLQSPGHIFGPGKALWPKFVTETCQALGGEAQAALWPAAGVEFAIVACDVADDLADGDLTDDQQASRAPSATLALASLAQFCCLQAAQELGLERAHRIAELLAKGLLAACAGQDLDIRLEREVQVVEERALAASRGKSGSLAAMACSVGAACASDSRELTELAGHFGGHLGLVAQLLNDIAGITPCERLHSTDILRRKKTLPVAYALTCAREEGISSILSWYEDRTLDVSNERSVAMTIHDLGALHYTWLVATIHRKQALETIRSLERLTGRASVRALRQLVPSLTSS